MSLKVSVNTLTGAMRERIVKDLTIKIEDSKKKNFSNIPKYISPYELEGDDLFLPFSYALNVLKLPKPKSEIYPNTNIKFAGQLREHQKVIKDEAISNMNKYGTTVIACYPGFGKTCTGIYISSVVKKRTLIVLNRLVLMEQWIGAIKKFSPESSVKYIQPKKGDIKEVNDFVIVNAINVRKFSRSFFSQFGLVLIDEAHMIVSEVLSQALEYLTPKYLVALTATPYRPDGFDILMELYFSEHKIVRKLYRNHKVYKIDTKFTPEVEYDRNGKINWGKILESQCCSKERNELIINTLLKHKDRNILILSKRIEQAEYFHTRLKEMGESVTILVGSETEFDKDARILIGTTNKIGVGFDHDKLDMLVLASDIEEYFIQYLGRVFRREDVEPVVLDFVDENNILKKHFATRKKVYLETGGKLSVYKNE